MALSLIHLSSINQPLKNIKSPIMAVTSPSSISALTNPNLSQPTLFSSISSSSVTSALHFTTLTSRSGSVRFVIENFSRKGRLCTVSAIRDSKASVITGDSWEELVLKNSVPVLVEFYASWCGPCKMVHRVVDEIAYEYAGKLKCFILNTDTDLHIAEDYEIKAVPVVVLFKNGKKHQAVFGTMPKEYYVDAIEKILHS